MKYVYIAGPFSEGDILANVNEAIWQGQAVYELNMVPFIPHLYFYWDAKYPKKYQDWMQLTQLWLEKCDVLYRFPGYSRGADQEMEFAIRRGMPVFKLLNDLAAWYRENP